MDYTALGQRIRQIRQQRNLTQSALAEKTGLSASFIGHIERGTRVLSLETFVSLCGALGASPAELLEISDLRPIEAYERERLLTLMAQCESILHGSND